MTHGTPLTTKSAINNIQASGYVMACNAPEYLRSNFHGRSLRTGSLRAAEPPQGSRKVNMQYDSSHWRHNINESLTNEEPFQNILYSLFEN